MIFYGKKVVFAYERLQKDWKSLIWTLRVLPDASSWQHCIHIVPFLWNVENDFESYFLALQGHRVYERSFLGKKIDMYLPNSNHKWTHNNRISSSKSDLEHPVHHHSPFREDMSNGSHFYGRCGDKYRSFEFEQNEEKDNKKQQRMKLTLLIHNIIPPKKGREKLQEYIYPSSVNDFFALCLLSCQRMQSISVF